jgi:hypothetical protein
LVILVAAVESSALVRAVTGLIFISAMSVQAA